MDDGVPPVVRPDALAEPAAAPDASVWSGARARLHGDSFSYACSGLESTACRHACSLFVALGSADVCVQTDMLRHSGRLLVVAPQVRRRLLARDVPFLMVDLEPSHPHFRTLTAAATGTGVLALGEQESDGLQKLGQAFRQYALGGSDYDKGLRRAIRHLGQAFAQPPALDERVRWMMQAIDENPSRSLAGLAQELSLSAEHACRLFSGQVGVSMRTYALSNKIRAAARCMGMGYSLTEVALMAGFVDSAHFAKVWVRCYGRAPSAYFPAERTRMDCSALPGWIWPPPP